MIGILFILMPIVGSVLTKFSHKIFGKPQKTIEEEQKAKMEKEQAQKELEADMTDTAQPVSHPNTNSMVNKYMQQQESINTPQKIKNSKSSFVDKYIKQMQNTGSYYPATKPLMNQAITNNYKINTFRTPDPLNNNDPETIARLNAIISKSDRDIKSAEKTLNKL